MFKFMILKSGMKSRVSLNDWASLTASFGSIEFEIFDVSSNYLNHTHSEEYKTKLHNFN